MQEGSLATPRLMPNTETYREREENKREGESKGTGRVMGEGQGETETRREHKCRETQHYNREKRSIEIIEEHGEKK